ncbi:CBS domain-containing protein [Agrococcus sp. HG114]|uniref:magnesium transporter MgtE N-terminal domain-containing protein n=1 Tax=Agrococcus sp. HG114 TaxID=2969757 RepID=UPI00215A2164|nr:CBS domain-containing protein [Agrococcus sp. HG114]MCR8670219.1 CBS domain-containing protein [Agrococcus sp. HG114]
MSAATVFVARLAGAGVFDPAGERIGKVRDVVTVPRQDAPPRVVGLAVEDRRRQRVFLSIGRVLSIGGGQLIASAISERRFSQRGSERLLLADVLGRTVTLRDGTTAVLEDLSIAERGPGEWEVDELFLRKPKTSPFGKGPTLLAHWGDVQHAADAEHDTEHLVASLDELPAADAASAMLDLPQQRMIEVAEDLSDDRLADILEEMNEDRQVEILASLADDRVADVLDQMEPDDAADLIAHMPADRGEALLELMDPEEAEDVRMLLAFGADTAGGLMTTEPIIVASDATVAEALALIRRHEVAPALAAAICVTLPPYEAPTGRFLGMVHFQRLLRYPPNERVGTLLDDQIEPVLTSTSAAEVTRELAAYNLVSVPVVDTAGRLVGVVTIDDVLDHLLPEDWRAQEEAPRG